jgi:Xaa-Pro aminopeptidase
MGGYVRYFTDVPATNGYPVELVFPADDQMTVACMGPFGSVIQPGPQGDGVWRGVKKVCHTPAFVTADYTRSYGADLAAEALKPYANATIGLVGTMQIAAATLDRLSSSFTEARFVDATDLVDRIKAVKSAEEQKLIRATAALQDEAMVEAFKAIRPGMRDREVAAVAKYHCERNGSEQGIYLCASAPAGTPFAFGPQHFQNRIIQEGDQFALLVETNGPGGFYCEIGRSCVLGPVPERLQEEHAFTLAARRFTLDLLKPGASSAEVFARYNAFMRDNGRPEERRLHCHAQGYDMVERPLIRNDETMPLMADINLAVHPTYVHDGVMSWICDNYLIEAAGPSERLHRFPEIVTEI